MNRGKQTSAPSGGYTIIEVMIFLAVSALMFFMAMVFISGKQAKAEFQNAVRDFESQLTDVANNVATGYYAKSDNFSCTRSGSPAEPRIDFGSVNNLGQNTDCIYVGTVLKFNQGPTSGPAQFNQVAMAGLRESGGGPTATLADANPRPIADTGTQHNGTIMTIGGGAWVGCVAYDTDHCDISSAGNAAVGFFTTFGSSSLSPSTGGNSIQADTYVYPTVNLGDGAAQWVGKLRTPTQKPGNVVICLRSGGNSEYALVKIGGGGNGSSVITTEVKSGGEPCS